MSTLASRCAVALTLTALGIGGWASTAAAAELAPQDTPCVKYSAAGQTGAVCIEEPQMPVAAYLDDPVEVPDVGKAFGDAVLSGMEQATTASETVDKALPPAAPARTETVLGTAGPTAEQVRSGLAAAMSQGQRTAVTGVEQAPKEVDRVDAQVGDIVDEGFDSADFVAKRLREAFHL